MQLRAQIQRIVRNAKGPLFQTLFLLKGCDLAAPEWTESARLAATLAWEHAESIAPQMGAHAVVIASANLAEDERAQPVPTGEKPKDRIVAYRRRSHFRRSTSQKPFEPSKVVRFQRELERQKLA